MRIDLLLSPHQTDDLTLRDKRVVVVDVLRASTTIVTALQNGAKEIIPVASIERAVKISGSLFGDAILRGGERNGKMIDGFNLGNSPAEYVEEKIKGKVIIFCTTNGSLAIERARYARTLYVCGFVNITAVGDAVKKDSSDVTILCAGKSGNLSLEDTICAGMLVRMLSDEKTNDVELSDSALSAATLHKSLGRNIHKMVKGTEHGKYLQSIGFGEDLSLCSQIDAFSVVPQLIGNALKLKTESMKPDTGIQISA